MRPLIASALLLVPALAFGGGKSMPADQHEPPLFADFGATWINVVGHDSDYTVSSAFRIAGATSSKDRARMDWKSQGKVVGSASCSTSYYEQGKTLNADCAIDKHQTAVGAVDVDLVYIDDQNDTESVVATYHVTVKSWKRVGKFLDFGLLADDLLAAAFVRHWYGADDDTYFHKPLFEFWTTAGGKILGDATLRCTVDGKKIDDFDAHIDNPKGGLQHTIEFSAANRTYSYQHVGIDPDFHFGSKDEHGIYDPTRMKWLIDHPGKWDCMLRKNGHQIRELMFTVNEKGMVLPSDMQGGKRPLRTLSNVVLIDMKIPADNGVEQRIRPDAMKKSIGFGTAWPDGARAAELQAAFPPASGLPD